MAELYHLKTDPGETTNLIGDEKYEATVARLRRELDQRIAESHPGGKDKMPMDEGIKGELPDEKIR
jgi:N-acetylglucosamine-6-sulfatase